MSENGSTTGVVSGVYESGNGWHDIRLEGDDRKFSTKRQSLISDAKELRDRMATIEYSVSRNGDFTNYRLEGIGKGSSLDDELQRGTAGSNGAEAEPRTKMRMDPQERAEMRRSVALKAAVEALPHFPALRDKPDLKTSDIVLLSDQFEAYLEKGHDVLGAVQS